MVTLGEFILFLLANNLLHVAGKRIAARRVDSAENAVETILEYVQGAAVIKSYNLTGNANKKVSDAIAEEETTAYATERVYVPLMSLQGLVTKIAGLAIILFAVIFYIQGTMELGHA